MSARWTGDIDGSQQAIVATGLRRAFAGLLAVDDVDLTVPHGSITGLIGPNGAGKSTLFAMLAGALDCDAGTVVIDGRDVSGCRPHVVARAGAIRTHQNPRILSRMSVRDNLLLAGHQPGESLVRWTLLRSATRRREAQLHDRADEMLVRFQLRHVADDYAGTLSGGQRKLLVFARALMADPSVLLL